MMTSAESVKKYYDEHVDSKLKDFVNGNKRVERAWISINELLHKLPKNVLEIGCGIGYVAWRMSKQFKGATITAFDISEQSIHIANKMFANKNLVFVNADKVEDLKISTDQKFDLIYMMDVYEHIEISERKLLHEFLNNVLAPEGIFFISCPTPKYLHWLNQHFPDKIQPVDEYITLDNIVTIANGLKRNLIYYKEISVWNLGDYFHAAFANQSGFEKFTDKPLPKNKNNSIKEKIISRLHTNRSAHNKELNKSQRSALVKSILGK